MKKHYLWLAALALGFTACTEDALTPEAPEQNQPEQTTPEQTTPASILTRGKLTSFASSQSRVTLAPESRAYPIPGSIELFASIENPSKTQPGLTGFVKEEGGRYLSATCVYFDQSTNTYYATYHMQGNNYNTQQENETAGFIESFTLDENGAPTLGKIVTYASTDGTTMDFNHLYFDDLANTNNSSSYSGTDSGVRFIVAGHSLKGKDQKAMIGRVDFEGDSIEFATVYTGDKLYDGTTNKDGDLVSLGNEDAKDVNCVLRKYDWYYLATRKGIAVLNAKKDNLFTPAHDYVLDENGKYQIDEESVYFIKTPGSAKHVAHYYPAYGSGFSFLYITQPFPASYDGTTSLPASLINFSMESGGGTLCGMDTKDSKTTGPSILNSKDFDLTKWSLDVNQFAIGDEIAPIDGKNVIFNLNGRLYACLGKTGLYVRKYVNTMNGNVLDEKTIKFTDAKDGNGSRPVNGVFVEDVENFNDGFIYVANGACLTVLDRETLEKVAEISAFDSEAEVNDASANYVYVTKTDHYTGKCPDRLVTVAYGQAGVKVFKFVPPTR